MPSSFVLVHHLKPKLNQVFSLGFLLYMAFFDVGADGGLCRERLLTRAGSVVGFRAKANKQPLGAGRLASLPYTHAPERLMSRVPWNK